MKLTRKSLGRWLWFMQHRAQVEDYPMPVREPLSFRTRDADKARKANPKATR